VGKTWLGWLIPGLIFTQRCFERKWDKYRGSAAQAFGQLQGIGLERGKTFFGTDDADGHGYYLSFLKKSGTRFLETGCPPEADFLQKSAFKQVFPIEFDHN